MWLLPKSKGKCYRCFSSQAKQATCCTLSLLTSLLSVLSELLERVVLRRLLLTTVHLQTLFLTISMTLNKDTALQWVTKHMSAALKESSWMSPQHLSPFGMINSCIRSKWLVHLVKFIAAFQTNRTFQAFPKGLYSVWHFAIYFAIKTQTHPSILRWRHTIPDSIQWFTWSNCTNGPWYYMKLQDGPLFII